ncbi:hypothetical protein Gogos_007849 [Gossypium gossypioides]|uniref:Uncharacterized protein n=1 Tax=Gossypium gossypioides TaxID=34282 RepID=A0A7J9C9Z1_GOSGO|nr:hypothetical protein [Gossypium gossypioides]
MARMKLMALALVILMMGNCCLAINRKVIKVEGDGLKHEQISVHGRQLLDDSGSDRASYPSSSINNHHFRPRQDFPGGGTGDGSEFAKYCMHAWLAALHCNLHEMTKFTLTTKRGSEKEGFARAAFMLGPHNFDDLPYVIG